MNDGSRNFVNFPETVFFDALRDLVQKHRGAKITNFLTDWVTEVWIDFEFRGHKFSINNQFGEYWFFVEDPKCSDEILFKVAKHYGKLLEK